MKLGTWGSPELLRTCLTVYGGILSVRAHAHAHTLPYTHSLNGLRGGAGRWGKGYYGLNGDS